MEINVDVDLDTHPKYHRLTSELKDSTKAEAYLCRLWRWAAKHCPGGDLKDVSTEELERFLHWNGKPGRLVAALLRCGWLDPDAGEQRDSAGGAVKARWVHGFQRRQGHVDAARSRGRNAAQARWSKIKGDKGHTMQDASNAPPRDVLDVLDVRRDAVRTGGADAPPLAQGGGGTPPEKRNTTTLARCCECNAVATPWSWTCSAEGCGKKTCNERGKTCKRDHLNRCIPVSPLLAGKLKDIDSGTHPRNVNGVIHQ